MVSRKFRLPKSYITKLYKNRQVLRGENFVIHNMPNNLGHLRFGIVVSKKVSKSAVVRNRVKRVFREAMKQFLNEYSKDMLITIQPSINTNLSSSDAHVLLKRSFERLPKFSSTSI